MELEHSFIIPVSPEQAWGVLLDVEQVAPCMPGATIDAVDGDEIKGRIKVKVGPVALTYAGTARFTEKDEKTRTVILEASGKETRGSGTAAATVNSSLQDEGGQTRVVVRTTMTVTGRPAQFGRGVIAEVGGRIIQKFASNLAAQLSGGTSAAASEAPSAAASEAPSAAASEAPSAAASNGTVSAAAGNGHGTVDRDRPAGQASLAGQAGDASPGGQASTDTARLPIEELNLPVRSYNSLRREGVHTVGGLTARTEQDLLAIDGLGPQSVKEIKQRLADWGLALGSPAPAPAVAEPIAKAGAGTAAAGTATRGTRADSVPADQGADLASSNGLLPPREARPPDEDALDLLSVAGMPVLKRALPVLGFAFFAALLFSLLRRRRRAARG
jgi:carbon monoxide dehydrogenase subunit G